MERNFFEQVADIQECIEDLNVGLRDLTAETITNSYNIQKTLDDILVVMKSIDGKLSSILEKE